MKTEEDEAFDDLARRQGAWGGGFNAKRQAAMDKINSEFTEEYIKYRTAFPNKGYTTQQVLPKDYTTQQPVPLVEIEYNLSVADIKAALAQPAQEALYGMNQDDWKDVVAAITKVRDGRGIYLACRPADVFQEWFLHLGTAKLKEKNND
jgi:hypothetical protein